MRTIVKIKEGVMKEFNWLGECTLCNIDCCHNTDKSVPENECIRPIDEKRYIGSTESSDYRPLECRLFPFDIKEIGEKLYWIRWNQCHADLKLNYEQHMDFFERAFFRALSPEHIQTYASNPKLNDSKKPITNNYKVIREINWSKTQQNI
jgi:hypothetical protein